jgi:hypothetical protein
MTDTQGPTDGEDIRRLLAKLTEAWLKGHFEDLAECFHEAAVIRGPALQELARGKEACVRSYEDFSREATVEEFEEPAPEIDIRDNTAVAVAPWTISYTIKGESFRESGKDLYLLVREGGRWLIVCRTGLGAG